MNIKANFVNCLTQLLMLMLISISSLISYAQANTAHLASLKQLNTNALNVQSPALKAATAKTKNVAKIAMIFQPNCSWCKKQSKSLNKVFQQCQSSININLVGTQGNARQLKKELKHYPQQIPAFLANRKFLRDIGGYQASPTTLFYNATGELIAKKRGFIPEDKLANALKTLSDGQCVI